MTPRHHSLVGGSVIVLVFAAAMVHSAPPRPRRYVPTATKLAEEAYEELEAHESEERGEALKKFPASEWSQQDEFHNREASVVRDYAKKHRMPVRNVLDAFDRGAHERWPTRDGSVPEQKVIPCRPRLTY